MYYVILLRISLIINFNNFFSSISFDMMCFRIISLKEKLIENKIVIMSA